MRDSRPPVIGAGLVHGGRLATVDLTHSVYGRETLSAAGMPCSGLIDA